MTAAEKSSVNAMVNCVEDSPHPLWVLERNDDDDDDDDDDDALPPIVGVMASAAGVKGTANAERWYRKRKGTPIMKEFNRQYR